MIENKVLMLFMVIQRTFKFREIEVEKYLTLNVKVS